MAQTDQSRSIHIAQDWERTGLDEAKALSVSYANVLEIDMTRLRSVTIMLRIDDGAIDGDYIIYSTVKRNPSTTVTDDEWHEEVAATGITHNVTSKNTITGNYTKIIVQAKSDSGTPTLKAWYRGMN